ncbi:lactate dehydrogenase [Mucilaginibacter conchicola]|uniref:Lactate dehydrogenase n=1 Tax=Mucilaginibacter conchicola TaxID=2303333 RepID=A0A372NNX9_9SPHI|nr:lactate dehydrogenase [Mucilaginibacter conchicola]RFZ89943.1 lactate dehydrogenase [Mucilaginibacter conchicola]
MKVVAYSIKPFEKEFLSRANQKKHDITLISNPLSIDTVVFATGKDAVVVFSTDEVTAQIIEYLANAGVKFIATRSVSTNHIDVPATGKFGIKVANVPVHLSGDVAEQTAEALQAIADQTIINLDMWQQNKCVGDACACAKRCRTSVSGKH